MIMRGEKGDFDEFGDVFIVFAELEEVEDIGLVV